MKTSLEIKSYPHLILNRTFQPSYNLRKNAIHKRNSRKLCCWAFSLVVIPTGKALPTARVWFAIWRQLLCRWLDDGSKLLLLAANLLRDLWHQFFRVAREAAFLPGPTACDWHHYETQGHFWSIQVCGGLVWWEGREGYLLLVSFTFSSGISRPRGTMYSKS